MLATVALFAAEPQRLTDDGALKLSPVFAAGGSEVLFATHAEPTRVALFRLRLADGSVQPVDSAISEHQFDPDVSADGRHLCFVLTANSPQSVLIIRDLEARTEFRYAPREARGTVRNPRFVPGQERIVFSLSDPGGQQIATVDLRGENLMLLTKSTGTNGWPAVSPDGRRIAFSSSRDGSLQIYVMSADGEDVRRITNEPQRCLRPAWSPDGGCLAFTSARDGNLDVYVVDADGANLRRITNHPDRDDFPVWHPDGRRLLMVCERDGNSDLYLVDAE